VNRIVVSIAAVDVCRGPVRPWSQEWPALRHLG